MKNVMKTQMEVYKSIRKPFAPSVKVERPNKGAGYRRHRGNWQKWVDNE